MQRSPAHSAASRISLKSMFAASATALLLAVPASSVRAQETNCPDGLMRRGEAGTGTLLLRTRVPGCFLPAPSVVTDFDVDIAGPVARIRVTQRFENPAEGWVEGVYLFPLPETAAVDTLKMQIGERFIEGDIKERQEARRIYEAAKAESKKASLVEQERPNMFTNQVANIGPHETIVVQIEYQETLRFDHGRYDLRVPLVVAPRYNPKPNILNLVGLGDGGANVRVSDPVPDRQRLSSPVLRPELGPVNPVSIHVALEAGFALGAVESETHQIAVTRDGNNSASITLANGNVPSDRDFALHFAPVPNAAPQISVLKERIGDKDYLLALVVPPVSDISAPALPRETIFVIDNSGSMAGDSMRQAKAGLLLGLERMKPEDRFNVIRFDDTMELLFQAPVAANEANLLRAKRFVDSLEANGGTEMLPALQAALTDPTPTDATRLRQVIFLTDGSVGNEEQLFKAINERLGRSRLFTVGIGSAPNSFFMSGAARAGRGTYTYVSDADQTVPRMNELFAKIERPAMTGLVANWPNPAGSEAWPNPIPDLYAGEPVVLTLMAPSINGDLQLTGNIAGREWRASLSLSSARAATGIEKLWARNKIASLDESRVYGVDADVIDKAVLDVALNHHLTSRLTSLVAVDVTPSRPEGVGITTGRVPLNLPAGWDFDKVFNEEGPRAPRMQEAAVPAELLTQLAMNNAPPSAVSPEESELVLAAGGTSANLMMLAGLILLVVAALVARRDAKVQS